MIGLMNYNVSRKDTGRSQLAAIQREQIDSMLVTNPNMMDNPEMYQGLDRVKAEFEVLKNTVLSNQTSKQETYTM